MPADTPIDTLLNYVQKALNLNTRTEAIRRVGTDPGTISKIRHGRARPSSDLILSIHEITGLSISDIRSIGKFAKPI